MSGRSSGFSHPGFSSAGGFQGDLNPEDLFNMFFGGGGGNGFGGANGEPTLRSSSYPVFTFGGPGFQNRYAAPRRRGPQTPDEGASPAMGLLPVVILFLFAMLTFLPSLFSSVGDPDPRFGFEQKGDLDVQRSTWQRGIPYFVNRPEWEASAIWQHVPEARRGETNAAGFSHKLRQFERGVEGTYIRRLQNDVREHRRETLTLVRILHCNETTENQRSDRVLWHWRRF